MKFVHALKSRNTYCAVTGDVMTDFPTLELAYVVLVMGLDGVDMAKEAANVILNKDMLAFLVRVMGKAEYCSIIFRR